MSKRKRDVYCPFVYDGRLPVPKWPGLDEPWYDEDIAEAEMVNSLVLNRPATSLSFAGRNQLDTGPI